jgi:hypothetical protein
VAPYTRTFTPRLLPARVAIRDVRRTLVCCARLLAHRHANIRSKMANCKYDWTAILRYHLEGHTLGECREKFGYAVDAWYKAIARGVIKAPPPQNSGGTRRYDWAEVQRYYDEGHSYRECRIRFGFAAESWHKAVRRGAIRTRDPRWPIDRVLREAKNRTHIKKQIACGRTLGEPLRRMRYQRVEREKLYRFKSITLTASRTTTVWKICVCFVRTATAKPKRLRAAIDQTN